MIKRIFSVLCAVFMIFSLAACNGGKAEDTGTENTVVDETADLTYEESVPDKDYGGAEFNILCTLEIAQFFDEESAHIQGLKSAVTSRNSKAKSLYNVDIKYTFESGNAANQDQFSSKVRTACMSGDATFDLVLPQARYGVALGLEGLYHNFNDSPYIQWDEPWYYQNINVNAEILDQTYFLASAFLMDKLHAAEVVLYNVDMGRDNGISEKEIYSHVTNGTWTIDVFEEYASRITVEAGETEPEAYGCVTGGHGVRALMIGSDTPFVEKTSDGKQQIVYYNEHLVDVFNKVNTFINKRNYVVCDDSDAKLKWFPNGDSLFALAYIGMMSEGDNLNSEVDFAILPIPKYNSEQENYITDVQRWEMVSSPIVADFERACLVLDALSYYTYAEVIPEYWDTLIGYRLARDAQVNQIVETIRSTITYDFTAIFQVEMGEIYLGSESLSNQIRRGDCNITSWWKGIEPSSGQWFDALYLRYENLAATE